MVKERKPEKRTTDIYQIATCLDQLVNFVFSGEFLLRHTSRAQLVAEVGWNMCSLAAEGLEHLKFNIMLVLIRNL